MEKKGHKKGQLVKKNFDTRGHNAMMSAGMAAK
jgi:hypothetical protein